MVEEEVPNDVAELLRLRVRVRDPASHTFKYVTYLHEIKK